MQQQQFSVPPKLHAMGAQDWAVRLLSTIISVDVKFLQCYPLGKLPSKYVRVKGHRFLSMHLSWFCLDTHHRCLILPIISDSPTYPEINFTKKEATHLETLLPNSGMWELAVTAQQSGKCALYMPRGTILLHMFQD